jgi:hypothetical protein
MSLHHGPLLGPQFRQSRCIFACFKTDLSYSVPTRAVSDWDDCRNVPTSALVFQILQPGHCDEIIGISENLIFQASDSSELHDQFIVPSCTIPNESRAGFVSE